jgi:predicted GNAT superfamily acetyltransferase
VAVNAHLNLSRLGARAIEYVPDMYGQDTESDLHRDLGTDRFLVEWRLRDPGVEAALAQGLAMDGEQLARAPVVTGAAEDGSLQRPLSRARTVLVEIPADILQVRARSPEEAWRWRRSTRRAFRHYLDRGYVVAGWHRRLDASRSAYVLTQR